MSNARRAAEEALALDPGNPLRKWAVIGSLHRLVSEMGDDSALRALLAEQGAGGADPFARVWDNPEDAVYAAPLAPPPAPEAAKLSVRIRSEFAGVLGCVPDGATDGDLVGMMADALRLARMDDAPSNSAVREAAEDDVREAIEMLRLTIGMRALKGACTDRACSNVALGAANLLAALAVGGPNG